MDDRNDGLQRIIDEALESMAAEAAGEFDPQSCNLAEFCRRTGISRQRARTIKANGFKVRPHGRTGTKAARTVLTGHTGLVDDLLRRGVTNSQVVLERLREQGYAGGLTTVKGYISAHADLVPPRRRAAEPRGGRGQRFETGPGEAYQMDAPVFGSETFPADLEAYLEDRIGLRTAMVNGNAVLNDVLFNELEHPTYAYGKEGYVMQQVHEPIEYGAWHETFAEFVAKMARYCEERGVRFYFQLDPEKNSVYRRYLSDGVRYDDSWVDALIARLEGLGVTCVSNRDYLTGLSYSEQVYNRQYDANHWNELGCFRATNRLLARMNEDMPEVRGLREDQYDIGTTVATTLPVSEFAIHEEVPTFELRTPLEDLTGEWEPEVVRHPSYRHFNYFVNGAPGAERLPRGLFFHGSYYNSRLHAYCVHGRA